MPEQHLAETPGQQQLSINLQQTKLSKYYFIVTSQSAVPFSARESHKEVASTELAALMNGEGLREAIPTASPVRPRFSGAGCRKLG